MRISDKRRKLKKTAHIFSVAPMMDWTDRHDRYLLRLISRHALLYTEMVTTGALIHGERARFLHHDAAEHPVALQLGGSDPADLATCAAMGADYGYDEINLNVGCPSDRVQAGTFGACLMAEPDLVARCIEAMNKAVAIPVTVKCRIGIDDQEPETALRRFIATVKEAGCTRFIIHARKAWLKGLSPKENRDIPPLDYPLVHAIARENPDLDIVINGGIVTLEQTERQLRHVDGVMMGREAYRHPYILAEVDRRLYGDDHPIPSRKEIAGLYGEYIDRQMAEGVPLIAMTRHILGLMQGCPGARAWRRYLSENAASDDRPGSAILRHAASLVSDTP